MSRWPRLAVVLAAASLSCASPKEPIFLHSKFGEIRPHTVALVPIQDHRTNRGDDADLQKTVSAAVVHSLEFKHYWCEPAVEAAPDLIEISHLQNPTPQWLATLGPPEQRWVLVVAVLHLETQFVLAVRSKATVHGYLFDKFSGELLWEDEGTASLSVGPALATLADDGALEAAVQGMLATFPERR